MAEFKDTPFGRRLTLTGDEVFEAIRDYVNVHYHESPDPFVFTVTVEDCGMHYVGAPVTAEVYL